MNRYITYNVNTVRTLKICFSLFSVTLLLSCSSAYAKSDDLESARKDIIATLKRDNPDGLPVFNAFFKQYDKLAINFFDKKNNESLKDHVDRMEDGLGTLKDMSEKDQYKSIRDILSKFHTKLAGLIGLLKEYIGTHNTFSCAIQLLEYKHILPHDVKERSDFSLYWSLDHRLKC